MKRVTHRKVFCAFARHGHNVSLCGGRGLLLREYYRGRYDLVRAKLVLASTTGIATAERSGARLERGRRRSRNSTHLRGSLGSIWHAYRYRNERASRRPTANPGAYDLYLRALG